MKKFSIFSSSVMIFLLLPFYVIASTNVTDNITQNTTWDILGSPYIITKEIQAFSDIQLTIDPGVEVRFDQDAALIIAGELKAVGTNNNNIKFTSNSLTPSIGDWKYIQFLDTATTTKYQPEFVYDYVNHQILLTYYSGSIFDYCIIEYADIGIITTDVYPGVMNSNIKSCNVGVSIDTSQNDSPVGPEKWLYFYNNTVEKCEGGLIINTFYNNHALISNNTFKENQYYGLASGSATKSYRGWESGAMLFNNQFINNVGTAIKAITGEGAVSPPFVFMEHNKITFNGKGAAIQAYLVALHNYVTNNRSFSYLVPDRYVDSNGGGLCLYGPEAYLFNNTIQLNGVDTGGHGDGIYLSTAMWVFDYELNKFIIRNNNLGNSVWDTFDIYVGPLTDQCSFSLGLEVDATNNYWMTPNPADTIFDANDDACAGVVHYDPKAISVMIPSPIEAHPTLLSPANYSETERPPQWSKDSINVNFSWSAVPNATKYLVCTYGKTYIDSTTSNIVEVTDGTSATLPFYTYFDNGDYLVHWFVVAGNDDGWGLPSDVKHIKMVKSTGTGDETSQTNSSSGGGSGGGCFINNMIY